jgi:hypothetical protein
MAMGQAVGTSGGGYDQHIAVLDNTYRGVFGNDRCEKAEWQSPFHPLDSSPTLALSAR